MHPDVERPLAVDLDGTLIRTDLLMESASSYATGAVWGAIRILRWLTEGRDRLKVELAHRVSIEPATLPYRADVLNWLTEQHRTGRVMHLVSASADTYVQAVAEHLGIFETHAGTRPGVNLKAKAKRDLLVERFGAGGFDYLGDDAADLPVWASAHTAHVVGNAGLVSRASRLSSVGEVFPGAKSTSQVMIALTKAMRPHQWLKNLLVGVPLLTAQLLGSETAVLRTILAMVLFSITASGVYLLNDIIDIPDDRTHPTKRLRPFASGQLGLVVGWLAWPVLSFGALGLAIAFLPWQFALVLAAYFILTLAYTFYAKRRGVLDVVTLGGLYTIRLVAGGAAIVVPLSIWLTTFSMLFFLSLALIKRVSELTRLRRSGATIRGRGYYDSDLELLSSYGVATSIGSVVIFSLYLQDTHVQRMYATPEILGAAIPILLAWLMRSWLWAHRGDMNEDPIVFAATDRRSLLLGAAFITVFVLAKLIHT